MSPISLKITFLSLVIALILINIATAGKKKKHKDDDDYDDDDEECYPGRNCIPGCYCSDSECRPYTPPKTHQHGKMVCKTFHYPQWKLWKKGSKDGIGNSTVIVMAHHLPEKSDQVTNLLSKNNFTTFEFQDVTSLLIKEVFENETTTSVPLLPTEVPSTTPEFLTKSWSSESNTASDSQSVNKTTT
ncbi:hypothetical protein Ocin01_08224 [Orchesella cincta]|uniref:Uncharacterized protein n=1 Tax=Orchesella cincta TaxID=48709 RepID=A0A1D2MZI0_ORCCI|nr:hypothetical protein Ocin01_08224 [Orchesella cincta]